MGRPARVSTKFAVKHLRALIDDGWTIRAIAAVSGVGGATISEALSGTSKKMTVENVVALLGVKGSANPNFIPADGTRRRLQSLVALGWLAQEVCRDAGLSPQFLSDLNTHDRATVSVGVAEAVAGVYAKLSMRIPELTPTRKRSKTMAAKRGWVPPLAWNNIDDPNEKPSGMPTVRGARRPHDEIDPNVVGRLLEGQKVPQTTNAERKEAMRRWLVMGNSERSLCKALGWHEGRYTPRKKPTPPWPALLIAGYWHAFAEHEEVAA